MEINWSTYDSASVYCSPNKCALLGRHGDDERCYYCCPDCDTDRHLCPGCGDSIDHFEGCCSECDDPR